MFKRCLRWFPQHELFLVTEEGFHCLRFKYWQESCHKSLVTRPLHWHTALGQRLTNFNCALNFKNASIFGASVFGEGLFLATSLRWKYTQAQCNEGGKIWCQCECLANAEASLKFASINSSCIWSIGGVFFNLFP